MHPLQAFRRRISEPGDAFRVSAVVPLRARPIEPAGRGQVCLKPRQMFTLDRLLGFRKFTCRKQLVRHAECPGVESGILIASRGDKS